MSEPDKWHMRKRIEEDKTCRNQICRNKIFAELVWGHWEPQKENRNGSITPAQIVGTVVHTIDGPTAEQSVQDYADDLNRRKVPFSQLPAFKPANNRKGDPNQISLLLIGADLAKTKPKK